MSTSSHRWFLSSPRAAGLATLVMGAVVIAAALFSPGVSAQPRGGGPAWEYGELRLLGLDAVFIIDEQAWFLEGPQRRDQIATKGEAGLQVNPPLDLIHLNTLGEAGWVVVPVPRVSDAGGGRAYLMRRPL